MEGCGQGDGGMMGQEGIEAQARGSLDLPETADIFVAKAMLVRFASMI